MKRLDVLMPSRNSYSDVMLGRPSSMMVALAVVPPMSKMIVSFSVRAAARRAPPITPPAGPDATTSTGFSHALAAATIPPFEVMTNTGAAMPMSRRPSMSRVR